jgi:4-amino-4-deoxy-L-arabinose transferase-like glycosyltransferase
MEPEPIMAPAGGSGRRRFWMWLSVWTAVGLGIRLVAVCAQPNRATLGDAVYAHGVAALLVAGKGFINPLAYTAYGHYQVIQTAGWPPLWTFVLTVPIFFGFHSFFAARIWSCLIGAGAIVVCGLAGREIGGRRVGLIAALLIAVYPNIWMNVEQASSETLSPLMVALILWTAYRFWHRPTPLNIAALGASIGLGALCRDEISLLFLFVLVPLVLILRSAPWRRRITLLVIGGAMAGVVVLPWVGYNLSRFTDVVTISDGLGPTLLSANCNITYSGPGEGYWSGACVQAVATNPKDDESVDSQIDETKAIDYIRAHKGRLPVVTLARIGRGLGFFHPVEQVKYDAYLETRPYHWALVGLGMYYGLLALTVGGSIVLRRRKVLIFPLWAVLLDVVSVFVISFGQTRYRVTFEVSLVILASVQLDWFWTRLTSGRGRGRRREGTVPVDGGVDPASSIPNLPSRRRCWGKSAASGRVQRVGTARRPHPRAVHRPVA